MQAREEKQLEASVDAIIQRVTDIKASLSSMLYKIENEFETLNWPTFLDNYAVISGHLTSLSKLLNHDKCPPLRNLTVLPLMLCPERDEQLLLMTEGRVSTFAHDLVPDYLRTKLEPMAENKMLQLEHKAATLTYENAQKQVAAYQKVVTHIWDLVNKAREEWEVESSARGSIQQNSNTTDSELLVAAVGIGKGLKMISNPNGQPNQGSGMVVPSQGPGRPGIPPNSGSMTPGNQNLMVKAPSSIKTNIKSGSSVHPYAR